MWASGSSRGWLLSLWLIVTILRVNMIHTPPLHATQVRPFCRLSSSDSVASSSDTCRPFMSSLDRVSTSAKSDLMFWTVGGCVCFPQPHCQRRFPTSFINIFYISMDFSFVETFMAFWHSHTVDIWGFWVLRGHVQALPVQQQPSRRLFSSCPPPSPVTSEGAATNGGTVAFTAQV